MGDTYRSFLPKHPVGHTPGADRPLLTVREVAVWLHLHPNTVKRISPKALPFIRVGTRGDRRYSRGDVEAYLDRSRSI